MNVRDTLPKQSEIEEFLGREFFPKYPYSLPLLEAVDMVQLEWEVTEEARQLRTPRGHGTDGTILECLTNFAILRLMEQGYVIRTGKNTFKASGKRYIEHVPRKDIQECLISFRILKDRPVDQICDLLKSRWDEDTILATRAKWELTTA
jgi:hypothetical protein